VEILFCFVLRHGFDRLSLTLLTTKQKDCNAKRENGPQQRESHSLTLRQAQCDNIIKVSGK